MSISVIFSYFAISKIFFYKDKIVSNLNLNNSDWIWELTFCYINQIYFYLFILPSAAKRKKSLRKLLIFLLFCQSFNNLFFVLSFAYGSSKYLFIFVQNCSMVFNWYEFSWLKNGCMKVLALFLIFIAIYAIIACFVSKWLILNLNLSFKKFYQIQ